MRRSFLDQKLWLIAIALGSFVILTGEVSAFHKAAESATEEHQDQQSFNQLLQERNMARDRARDHLLEKAKPASDASVTVKIRHRDEDAESSDRGEVIAEMKMSQEDVAKGKASEVYQKVKANAGSTVVSRPAGTSHSGRHDRVFETTEREQTAAWMLAGLVGLGLFAWWWYTRRYQPI